MHVFLETERLVLRRFTENDGDLLVELDSDPEVMHFITGGRQTPRREIESEILPRTSPTTSGTRGSASGLP